MCCQLPNYYYKALLLLLIHQNLALGKPRSEALTYETVVQGMQEKLSYLEQKVFDLSTSETEINILNRFIEKEVPLLRELVTGLNTNLNEDKYLVRVSETYKLFSDPLKELWTKVYRLSDAAQHYFKGVTHGVSKLAKSYRLLLETELDKETTSVGDDFKTNLTELLQKYLSHTFSLSKSTPEQKIDLSAFEKQCQALAVEVAEYETNRQVSKRIRRSIGPHRNNVPCTNGDWKISPTSKLIHWNEDITLKIPSTVTFAVLSCYELQAAETVIRLLLFLTGDSNPTKLTQLQEKDMDLTLTAVWLREKFLNAKIEQKLVNDESGSRLATQSVDGSLLEARDIWICDPEQYIVGSNVIRFSGVYQACIEKEADLNADGSCSGKCKYYLKPRSIEKDYVEARSVCRTKQCKKDLKTSLGLFAKQVECKRLEGEVKICPARSRAERYTWFSHGNQSFGKKDGNDSCHTGLQASQEEWIMEDGSPLMKSPQFCELCLCECNHAGVGKIATAYISTTAVLTDVANNMVLTGVRFEAKHGIIFISIEQGKFLADGKIDQSTLVWIKPSISGEKLDRRSVLKLNYDFQKLSLDDIENINPGSDKYVLTGIRLRLHKDTLSLEAQLTQFDTNTHALVSDSSIWINKLDEPEKRNVLSFSDADSPIETTSPSIPDSGFPQVIQFSSASMSKTAGQVVVPYFDGQNVFPTTRSPLRGIGLFHKGQPGYGGFVAFRLLVFQSH